ncbi:metallophosphoesterase [Spirosoma terrae]
MEKYLRFFLLINLMVGFALANGQAQVNSTVERINTSTGQARTNEVLVRGPYLQKATPTSMTFRWRTDPASVGVVRFGASTDKLTGMVSEAGPVTDHEVTVTGLNPNTQYFYSVGTAAGTLQGDANNYFITFPAEGTPKKTRIWSLGDFGYYNSARQANVKKAFKDYMRSIGDPHLDLWLWLGDNAYNGGQDSEYQAHVFSSDVGYGGDRYMKQTPFFATPGNHDYAGNGDLRMNLNIPYYGVVSHPTKAEAGGVPSGTESYYSFNYGNIHFVSLDSDRYEDVSDLASNTRFLDSRPQINWLKQDLAAAQANPNIKWIIAYWHHPPYTKGTHDSDTDKQLRDVRMNLLPVLEQYKVDLVMCGHSHVYERSRLIKGHYGDAPTFDPNVHNVAEGSNARSNGRFDGSPNSCYYFKSRSSATNEGTIYVVNGTGGAPGWHITSGTAQWPHNAMEVSYDNANLGGSMYIEIEGGKLTSKMIAGDGSIQDQFTIIKDADSFAVPATDGTTRSATCECTDGADGRTYYTDGGLNKLLSIKKNGQDIGRVGDGTFALQLKGNAGASLIPKNGPAGYVNAPSGWYAANRYFTLKTTKDATSPLALSFFYTQADLEAINKGIGQSLTPQQLKVFTIGDGATSFNPDPATGHIGIPKASSPGGGGATILNYGAETPSATTWTNTTLSNGTYRADFLVTRTASGGIGGAMNGADPTVIPLSVTLTASPTQSPGQTSLLATAIGTAPLSYSFSGPGSITSTSNTANVTSLTVAGPQLFSVVVADAAGQKATATVSVTVTSSATVCENFYVGPGAGFSTTTGCENVALGPNAAYVNTTGTQSTFVGSWAGFYSNGQGNTFLGYRTGQALTTGSFNTFLGYQADAESPGLQNATAIGTNAKVGISNAIVLGNNANVGIGTNAPRTKLEVNTGASGQSGVRLTQLTSALSTTATASKFLTVNEQGDVYLANYASGARQSAETSVEALWQRKGQFLQSAKGEAVIIGEGITKTSGDYNLFVSKGILTEKLKVSIKNTADWSDHVFSKTYQLAPLADVEQFIRKHQHLPGVPSASELTKEGMDVAAMNAKLLEKIEELTLYVIDLKKEVETLRKAAKPAPKKRK